MAPTFFMDIRRKINANQCALIRLKNYLKIIGLWANDSTDTIWYKIYNRFVIMSTIVFTISLTWDLYEASSDFVILGDDICVLIGAYLILFKMLFFRILKKDIEILIEIFNKRHDENLQINDDFIKDIQRNYQIYDVLVVSGYGILGEFLFAAICFQPIFSGNYNLPFRAKFPFTVKDGPVFLAVYIFQCVCTSFMIKAIVLMDNIGCALINQSCLQLDILSYKIEHLVCNENELRLIVAEHQNIIRITEKINEVFHPMFVAQVVASIMIICLTAFEATLVLENRSALLKFLSYMMAEFMQLFYWCFVGQRTSFKSTQVAVAVYNNSGWLEATSRFKGDLRFVIFRSQKPLRFRAYPLYDLNFESFLIILGKSYTFFTLLQNLHN